MPKSLPPFMFCFLACKKEEGEEDGGLLLVMPHNTSTLTASFNIYFLPFSGLTVNMLISVILLLKQTVGGGKLEWDFDLTDHCYTRTAACDIPCIIMTLLLNIQYASCLLFKICKCMSNIF